MAAIIPDWQTGRNLTVFTLTKQTAAADGTLSDSGTAQDVRAVMEEFGHEVDVETEEVRPIWSVQQNEVYISSGNRGNLTTINRSNSAAILADVANTHTAGYVKLNWIEGKETYTGYFKVGRYTGGFRGHGHQVKVLELLSCDPGEPQVTRVVAA